MIKEKTEKLNLSKYTEDSKEGLMLIFIITTHLLLKKSKKRHTVKLLRKYKTKI